MQQIRNHDETLVVGAPVYMANNDSGNSSSLSPLASTSGAPVNIPETPESSDAMQSKHGTAKVRDDFSSEESQEQQRIDKEVNSVIYKKILSR